MLPLPHNLYDYCSIRISSLVEKYLVVKRKISFVDKVDILLIKLIIREVIKMANSYFNENTLEELIEEIKYVYKMTDHGL